jgi:hypothetical protein
MTPVHEVPSEPSTPQNSGASTFSTTPAPPAPLVMAADVPLPATPSLEKSANNNSNSNGNHALDQSNNELVIDSLRAELMALKATCAVLSREKGEYESQIGEFEKLCDEIESKSQLQIADLNRSFEVERRKLHLRVESAEEKAFKVLEEVKAKDLEIDELKMKNGALITESEIKGSQWRNEKLDLETKLERERGEVVRHQAHIQRISNESQDQLDKAGSVNLQYKKAIERQNKELLSLQVRDLDLSSRSLFPFIYGVSSYFDLISMCWFRSI